MPRSTESGSQHESSSFSAKQKPTLPGVPKVARSTPPGLPPPTLRMTSCSARPMVELARLPWPSALTPEFMPIILRMGPFTMTMGPTNIVVATTPCRLNASSSAASTAAITTGM